MDVEAEMPAKTSIIAERETPGRRHPASLQAASRLPPEAESTVARALTADTR
jgi:hypothetical protein